MRKIRLLFFILTALFALQSCAGQSGTANDTKTTDITDSSGAVVGTSGSEIDIDLKDMSGTLIYAQVYNMVYSPDEYIGKTVRLCGTFQVYTNETGSRLYYTCLVSDATACCSNGIEFILGDGASYPDDYPVEGTEITVTGTFHTYMEDGYQYCELIDAKLG